VYGIFKEMKSNWVVVLILYMPLCHVMSDVSIFDRNNLFYDVMDWEIYNSRKK